MKKMIDLLLSMNNKILDAIDYDNKTFEENELLNELYELNKRAIKKEIERCGSNE